VEQRNDSNNEDWPFSCAKVSRSVAVRTKASPWQYWVNRSVLLFENVPGRVSSDGEISCATETSKRQIISQPSIINPGRPSEN
jgi:hypothetical protein